MSAVFVTTDVAAERYCFPNRKQFIRWAERNGVTLIRRGPRSRTLLVSTREIENTFVDRSTGQAVKKTWRQGAA